MYEMTVLFIGAGLLLLYGLISRRQVASYLTGPMLFVGAGAAAGFFLHASTPEPDDLARIRLLGELTLAIVLFTDSAHLKPRRLLQEESWPARMLFIGLPLIVISGSAAGYLLFPDWPFMLILLAALILAPTDAALGRFILEAHDVPRPLRETLNAESGLNDGFALPPILFLLAIMGGEAAADYQQGTMTLLRHLLLSPLAGAAIGFGGGWLITYAAKRNWMKPLFERLAAPALAICAYAGAEMLDTNGFIAAYAAGLMIPLTVVRPAQTYLKDFSETEAELLSLSVFFLFGLLLVPYGAAFWNWHMLAYALLSLTLIRMVPILLSLTGSGLNLRSAALLGWFGPRGIASILYLLLAFETLKPGDGLHALAGLVSLTVLLSIFAHGLSAVPLARAYAANPQALPLLPPEKERGKACK